MRFKSPELLETGLGTERLPFDFGAQKRDRYSNQYVCWPRYGSGPRREMMVAHLHLHKHERILASTARRA
jgi:hypothetical protein